MTGSAEVIRNLAIGFACVLASWSTAQACSPSPEAMSGVQNYRSITPSNYSSWFHSDLSIGLVYAKQKKVRKKKVSTGYEDKAEKKPFVKIEFNLINNISGDFIADETRWFPKIDKTGEARELKLLNKQKDFAFWDRRDLTVPQIYGYDGMTSCGPSSSDTLLPNQFYLHFKQKNRTVGLEIVSGPDDPLVKEFIKIQTNALESKITRKPIDYFNEMSGYVDLKIKACPHADSFEVYGLNFFGKRESRKDLISASFEVLDRFKSEPNELDLYDFYSYISKTNNHKLECKIGVRYLVIERLSAETLQGSRGGFLENPPRHRYLKIENELIDTNDILSMISVNSETPVSSTNVKTWIREANSK